MAKQVATYDRRTATLVLAIHYSDGADRLHDIAALPEAIRNELMMLGAKNKIGDSAAGKAKVGGPKAAREASDAMYAQLLGGDWDARGAQNGGIWPLAVARALGLDEAKVVESWGKMSEEKRAEVRANGKVKKAKLEIEAERLAEGLDDEDSEQLLEDFGGEA